MNNNEKSRLYDSICHLLTDYETGETNSPVTEDDLYSALVEITNKWEEITGEGE